MCVISVQYDTDRKSARVLLGQTLLVSNRHNLEKEITELLKAGIYKIVVDFRNTSEARVHRSCLGMLITLNKKARYTAYEQGYNDLSEVGIALVEVDHEDKDYFDLTQLCTQIKVEYRQAA